MAKRALTALIIAACLLSLSWSGKASATTNGAPSDVTIAYQPGIGYANLIVVKEQGTLEKQFPSTKFHWKVLANGAVIRDGIISNQIQFGAGGIGPFLIGWDKVPGFRLVCSLNEMDLWLVTMNPKITSIKDLKAGMRIGLPGIDSIQAIALRKAAQEQLGNAHALDDDLVAIPHPLGLQALLHGQLAAHLSSPPFEFEEVADGGHIVLRSYSLFGESTFNSVFTSESFYDANKAFVQTFYHDIADASAFIEAHPRNAAALLATDSGGKVPASDFERWITHKGISYVTVPHGFEEYAQFMHRIGLISKAPSSMADLELPYLDGEGN